MKLVKCIVRPETAADATAALEKIGISGITISDVRGRGLRTRPTTRYRGLALEELLPMCMLDIVAPDDLVEEIVRVVIDHARTGHSGDGRVFVLAVEGSCTIRTRQFDVA